MLPQPFWLPVAEPLPLRLVSLETLPVAVAVSCQQSLIDRPLARFMGPAAVPRAVASASVQQ